MELHNAVKLHGSMNAAAKALGMPPTSFRRKLEKERKDAIKAFSMPPAIKLELEPGESVRHFIITSAQDKTSVHLDFWNNLKAYAEYLNAEILIGGFTYSKKLFTESDPTFRSDDVWFAEEIDDYIIHDPVKLGDNVVFCAEMNTLPTAVQPLSGLETYTKDKWGIFPHAKIQLRSIATMKHALAKQIMTTGAVTMPNYLRKKAGVKAEFHHQIAAVIVTITDDAFFCRHLHATSLEDGSFYDMDRLVADGAVTSGHSPIAIVHGDVHIEKVDADVAYATWGYDPVMQERSYIRESLTDLLKPTYRIFHDLIDFSARNHHNINDHHFRMKLFYHGGDSVQEDLSKASNFLRAIASAETQDVVIQSNHDNALYRWVKETTPKNDPINYEFWLECELECVRSIKRGHEPALFEWAMQQSGIDDVGFINEDDTFMLHDVELAIHGHRGANGARGSAIAFAKMGPKSITGHTHSPSITDGHMCVGTNSKLDMGYNKGLSSWSHTNAILYPNGQRTLITLSGGRWSE